MNMTFASSRTLISGGVGLALLAASFAYMQQATHLDAVAVAIAPVGEATPARLARGQAVETIASASDTAGEARTRRARGEARGSAVDIKADDAVLPVRRARGPLAGI